MADETPLFSQYQALKAKHPDDVLMIRLGDFYEMFDKDADEIAKLLNLTLTHRGDRHMCGVPHHALKIYVARLLRYGKKIAIAEQIGPIAKKGLTKREMVEVITPGTAIESEYLNGNRNNFLASFCILSGYGALAYVDVTTGEFKATSFAEKDVAENFPKELSRCSPRELLLPEKLRDNVVVRKTLELCEDMAVSWYPDWNFDSAVNYQRLVKQFHTVNLRSFSLDEKSPEVPPAGFLVDYLQKTTNTVAPHVNEITVYHENQFVMIDDASRKNLEITANLRDGGVAFSLLECLGCSKTSMGARLLRSFLLFPLTDVARINRRQEHVNLFYANVSLQKKVREKLDGILDIERLAGRIAMERAHAKDLKALQNSLSLWLNAQGILADLNFIQTGSDTAGEIISIIDKAIVDDPPTVFTEGGIIKQGWSDQLDHWREIHDNFSKVLESYLEEEKAKTGISNLKIGKTGNLGYYIEVSRGKLSQVPDYFIQKRSMVNADRFTTEKLQELEDSLNDAGDKILTLDHDLFVEVRTKLKDYVPYLMQVAHDIAYVDVVSSFAEVAVRNSWVRPEISDGYEFTVQDGRHPVVERHIPSGEFVPNSLSLMSEGDKTAFALITGPNMAGKSTFLRQNALISLLAQTGSFVPCASAKLGVVDRIFCRVGASDNLARGESTFLVEMTETANILRSATERSFVIMDEVGRGTSTEDGLSIAWAVSEYLLDNVRCKTLFATHYHELTRLEHPAMRKLCMAVSDNGSEVVFLRKVTEGSSENSYGIHVARLAGVPEVVIRRAEDILSRIQTQAAEQPLDIDSCTDYSGQSSASKSDVEPAASVAIALEKKDSASITGSLFSSEELVLDEILSSDINNLTPLKSLEMLSRWKEELSRK